MLYDIIGYDNQVLGQVDASDAPTAWAKAGLEYSSILDVRLAITNTVEIYTPEQEAQDRSEEFTRMVREQGVDTNVRFIFVDAAWLEKSAYYPSPINRIEIFRTYPAFFRERNLAILAHEAGHAELYLKYSPPTNELLKEIEAYRRGMRLAEAWNVKDEFKELALHFIGDTLAGLPFERPVSVKDFEEARPELEKFLNELEVIGD